jgi:hypothetical protein
MPIPTVRVGSSRSGSSETREYPGAIAKPIRFYTHPVHHGQIQVGYRSIALELNVPTLLDCSATPACQNDGQIMV